MRQEAEIIYELTEREVLEAVAKIVPSRKRKRFTPIDLTRMNREKWLLTMAIIEHGRESE
jgi:hypothetical protein